MAERQRWKKVKQIFPCVSDDVWDQDPAAPNVVRVGDKLRMYYHGRQGTTFRGKLVLGALRIGFAEASGEDPFTWEKHPGNPVIDLGPEGAIDSHWAGYPWVIPITETHWHMYYCGWGGQFLEEELPHRKVYHIILAESDDGGVTWTRTGRSLFQLGRPFACDEHGAGAGAVCQVGDEYWMWYTALSSPRTDFYKISVALAISTDGGHTFEPHPAGALVSVPPTIGTPGATCSRPFVEVTDQGFRMWFSCATDGQYYRVHYAESADGIHFKWWPEPVLDVSVMGWDHEMTCYPSVLHLEGRTLMYYAGDRYAGIGVAELMAD